MRQRLSERRWTSHNIRLAAGLSTIPGSPDFLTEDGRLQALLRVLEMLYGRQLAGLRIADLGCLEGGYALALAMRGASVVGIEARATNFEKLSFLTQAFDLPNLEFMRGDVKAFSAESHGQFDVVIAFGILYHLDEPAAWLRRIAPAVRKALIVDSNYAPVEDDRAHLLHPSLGQLGPLERLEGGDSTCEGRWYDEFTEGADPERLPWAAFSNARSFWMTKESLLLALRQAGFRLLLEQHDANLDHFRVFQTECPRAMFVALK